MTSRNDKESTAYENIPRQNTKLTEREQFLISQVIARTETLDKLNRNGEI